MEKLESLHSDIFKNISTIDLENGNVIYKTSAASSKITKQVAIDFSLWQQTGECIRVLNDEDHWVHPYTNESITTEELFNEFLKNYEI